MPRLLYLEKLTVSDHEKVGRRKAAVVYVPQRNMDSRSGPLISPIYLPYPLATQVVSETKMPEFKLLEVLW